MATRLLLIGQGLFREGLEHLLAQEPSMTIVGSVGGWQEARALMASVRPDVLIVDHAAARPGAADFVSPIGADAHRLRIIHLTLAENTMVVYDQRQVADVSLTDLLSVLRS
jgi:DNA-binding NarL/FixJ family response regulator